MTSGDRLTWNLFFDIVAVLERHGNYLDHTQPQPEDSGTEAPQNAVIVAGAGAIIVFAALDIATDDKRYRVEMCPDYSDQSCPACQTDVRGARAFDQVADRMLQAAEAAPAATASQPGPDRWSQPGADGEVGQ